MEAGPMYAKGVRNLITLRNLDRSEIDWIVELALTHGDRKPIGQPLKGCIIGIYFALTSTRTRTAFATGGMRLGAHVMSYGPDDLQLKTGETSGTPERFSREC